MLRAPPLALCLIDVLMPCIWFVQLCIRIDVALTQEHLARFFRHQYHPRVALTRKVWVHFRHVLSLLFCMLHSHESRPHIRLCLYIAGCPRLTDQFDTGFLIILCMACCYLIPWFTLTQVRPHIRLYVSTDLYEYCPPGLQLAATRCPPAWVSIPYVLRYVFLIALIGIGKVEEY